MTALLPRVGAAVRRGRRLLKEATGESHWDDYVDHCRATGSTPMSRSAFERHRTEHRERDPRARCC